MTIVNMAVRIVLGGLALLAAQMIAGMLFPMDASPGPNSLPWLMVANLITVAVLAWAGYRSGWSGARLGAALFILPVAVATVNMIEGIVFLPKVGLRWERLLPLTWLAYALAAPVWVILFRRREPRPDVAATRRSVLERVWRFAASDVAYLVLYFTAGMIIFPWVADFYATQGLPSQGTIITLQLLLRGPVFVALCVLLSRMFRLPDLKNSLAVGLAFTTISGVAPLIIPNAFFPDAVRWVHFGEVVSSNFVFGALVAWIWRVRPQTAGLERAGSVAV